MRSIGIFLSVKLVVEEAYESLEIEGRVVRKRPKFE